MTEYWNKERFDEMVKNGLSEIYHESFPPAWPTAIKNHYNILAEENKTAFAGKDHELCAAVIATFKSRSSDYQTRSLGRQVSNNDAFYAYYLLGNAFYSGAAKEDEAPDLLKQAIDYYRVSVNFAKYSGSNGDSLKFWPLFAHYALALSVIELQDEYDVEVSDFKKIILEFSEECKRVSSGAEDVNIILPNEFLRCVNDHLRSFGSDDVFPSGKIVSDKVSDKGESYIASPGTVSAAPPSPIRTKSMMIPTFSSMSAESAVFPQTSPIRKVGISIPASPIRADGASAERPVNGGAGGEAPDASPSRARRLISKIFTKS